MTAMPASRKMALGALIALGVALALWLFAGRQPTPPSPPVAAGPATPAGPTPDADPTYVGLGRLRRLPCGRVRGVARLAARPRHAGGRREHGAR